MDSKQTIEVHLGCYDRSGVPSQHKNSLGRFYCQWRVILAQRENQLPMKITELTGFIQPLLRLLSEHCRTYLCVGVTVSIDFQRVVFERATARASAWPAAVALFWDLHLVQAPLDTVSCNNVINALSRGKDIEREVKHPKPTYQTELGDRAAESAPSQ
eukprot:4093633-Amphidinium_carterae.1